MAELRSGAGAALTASGATVKLPAKALYNRCDPDSLPELDGAADICPMPGQQRALEALEFGIGIHRQGYNLFVFGPNGSGRHSLVQEQLQRRAAAEAVPPDWCYINNFSDPRRPHVLALPRGSGERLRAAMRRLIDELLATLPAAFERDDYRGRREILDQQLKDRQAAAFDVLDRQAAERDIVLLRTPMGFNLTPLHNGKPMQPEFFQRLAESRRNEIQANLSALQEELERLMRQISDWEREHRDAVRALRAETAGRAIDRLMAEVRAAYADMPAVLTYLSAVERDIHEHIDEFLAVGKARAEQTSPGPLADNDLQFSLFRRYRVNALVQRDDGAGAPVIYEDHPTYQRLFGRIEHIVEEGALITDFGLIVPGALHRANGGYLILDAEKVLMDPFSWSALKRALRSRQLRLESVEQLLSVAGTISLDPEPIALAVTVVLVGPPMLYYLLAELDAEFGELFKIAAELDPDVPRSAATQADYARLMAAVARRDGLRSLTRAGAARAIEFAARLAQDAQRLSTRMRTVFDLLQEADFCAARSGAAHIGAIEVQAAIDARMRRMDRVPLRLQDEIGKRTLNIETRGSVVGQVNGLSVIALGDTLFGQPSRITAQVHLGRGEVIDIERQVKLGGPIHSKGVFILSGFLGARFGRHQRLSLAASLVFEQSYGMVEGDSASAAELCALLSALAGLPLRQELGVTGSIDQHGRIQAVGGVNEKIEGFFDTCRTQGLAPGQGAIIPAASAGQLMLRADVVAAAEAGTFSVYAVDNIDDCMALLAGLPAGAIDADGNYPPGTVNCRIAEQLAEFSARAAAARNSG